MANLWQESPQMDSPWDSDQDGWTRKATDSGTDGSISSGSGWSSDSRARSEPKDLGGWALDDPAEPTLEKKPLAETEHAWDAPAEDASWLSAGPSSAGVTFQPRWTEVEDPNEGWLDGDDDPPFQPEPEPVSHGGGGLWLAVVAIGLLLVFGLWSVTGKESKPEVDPELATLADALESGRLLSDAGRESLVKGEAESATSQLRKAITELKSGQAPAEEVWEARRLLGKAALRSGEFEEAHAVWTQLAAQKSLQAEAEPAIKLAAVELRKQANAQLNEAGAQLAQGDAAGAAALARESLSIYQRFGGDRKQLGRANGALGSALAKQGRLSTARSYLAAAIRHWPENSDYLRTLNGLGAGPYEPVPEVETSRPESGKTVTPPSIDNEKEYPDGRPGGGGGSSKQVKPEPQPAPPPPQPAPPPKPKSEPKPKPKPEPKPGRLGDKDVLPTY